MSKTSLSQARSWSELSPSLQVYFLSEGIAVSTALALAAELGIADLLSEGPRSSDQLAQATSTHAPSLYRVLRLLSSMGLFSEVESCSFALTPLGECLRSGVPGSMRSWVRMTGLRVWYHTYAEALHSVRTGEPVFKRATGQEFFDYFAAHPEEGEIFNGAMNDFGQVSAAVVKAYDFGGIARIADVGGGHGTLIAAILKQYPLMNGVLYELPHVVEGSRQAIAVAGLASRCEVVTGDFFQSVPAGCDAYILRWIIHDWDRDCAVAILRNCRQAMGETGRLLLVEAVISPGNDLHPGKLLDFVMLTGLGGQERTEAEYGDLLHEAGFRLNRIMATDSPMSIIEAVPAGGTS